MKKIELNPGLLWITGLSGSGKTTVSKIVYNKLKKKYKNIIYFDGDILRKKLKIKKNNSFSNKSRLKIGLTYVNICKKSIKNNKFVIISAMALLKKVHNEYSKLSNCKDVYLDVPIKELKKRDPKGLYKKFKEKKIKNMVGLDIKFDKPTKASLTIKWNKKLTAIQSSKKILKLINE